MIKMKRKKYGIEVICGSVQEANELACELDHILFLQKIGNQYELYLK